eukprot:TRINITY_DN6613_c0_g1_i1.p1 TRINITY_DN6613_c0_g1~~TRINITY_DN6613_c0_g1_i1.p1  ORF type:complete len:264 (+),score=47.17 TRINITY_DN6613_c0_g1_i1:134-925(+)
MTDHEFDVATVYVRTTKDFQANQTQQLRFYSLFKQATVGVCDTPKPGLFSWTERTKWDAWNDLGDLSSHDAKVQYIYQVLLLGGDAWTKHLHMSNNGEPVDTSTESSSFPSVGQKSGLGPLFSMPVFESDDDEDEDEDTMPFWASEGRLDDMKKEFALNASCVNDQDTGGLSSLMWACDRNQVEVVSWLIASGCDVNQRDHEGQTALHYACLCDYPELVKMLLDARIDTSIADNDGTRAKDLTGNACEETKMLLSCDIGAIRM